MTIRRLDSERNQQQTSIDLSRFAPQTKPDTATDATTRTHAGSTDSSVTIRRQPGAVPYDSAIGKSVSSIIQKRDLFDRLGALSPELGRRSWDTDFSRLAGLIRAPLFVTGFLIDSNSVSMNDIFQGTIGDCWMLAPLASLAQKDPEAIKRMIRDNGDGTYTVTFKEKHISLYGHVTFTDREITVTADFPGGLNGSGHAGPGDRDSLNRAEIWPLIIEKAYAQWKGGYDKIAGGGKPGEFLEAITGKPSFERYQNGPPPYDSLKADFDSGKQIVFSTPNAEWLHYGLVRDHAYAVQNIYKDDEGRQWVQLYNPWGNNHPAPIPYNEIAGNINSIVTN